MWSNKSSKYCLELKKSIIKYIIHKSCACDSKENHNLGKLTKFKYRIVLIQEISNYLC